MKDTNKKQWSDLCDSTLGMTDYQCSAAFNFFLGRIRGQFGWAGTSKESLIHAMEDAIKFGKEQTENPQ